MRQDNTRVELGRVRLIRKWKGNLEHVKFTVTGRETQSDLNVGEKKCVKDVWDIVLKENPKAFSGPTIRWVGGKWPKQGKPEMSLLGSNYRIGQVLGWLGVAMVPVTQDGFVALQDYRPEVAVTIGDGIRVPGCTPTSPFVTEQVLIEMYEEFGVVVKKEHLNVLGFIEGKVPLAIKTTRSKSRHALVVRVDVGVTAETLRTKCRDGGEESEGELLFAKLNSKTILAPMKRGKPVKWCGEFNAGSLLSLLMVAESQSGAAMANLKERFWYDSKALCRHKYFK